MEPWFWMSLANTTEWHEALNCQHSDHSTGFCCVCAPDAGDGASLCDAAFDLGAQVRRYVTEVRCARDRYLGPRGTFGACPYQCACGSAAAMRRRCALRLTPEMTPSSWSTELLADLRRDDDAYRHMMDAAFRSAAPGRETSWLLLMFFVGVCMIMELR